jgi:hypothetical protein
VIEAKLDHLKPGTGLRDRRNLEPSDSRFAAHERPRLQFVAAKRPDKTPIETLIVELAGTALTQLPPGSSAEAPRQPGDSVCKSPEALAIIQIITGRT